MTLTLEDYESKFWPKLQGAIDQLLNMQPGAYIPISYEQMYRLAWSTISSYLVIFKHFKLSCAL